MNKMLVFSLILDFCDSKGFCKPSFSDALQSLVEATPTKGQALSEKKCMNYHILSEKSFDSFVGTPIIRSSLFILALYMALIFKGL